MKTGLAPGLDLTSDFIVQFTALDPSTGSVVADVSVSNVSLLVDNVHGGDLQSGFDDIEPLFTPIPSGNLFPDGGQ